MLTHNSNIKALVQFKYRWIYSFYSHNFFYYLYVYILSFRFKIFNFFFLKNRNYFRQQNLKVQDKFFNYSAEQNNFSNNLFVGFKSLWNHLTYWFVAIILGIIVVYYLLVIKLLPFNKIIFGWLMLAMFFYWLISGFVFFIKKYRYAKFTSSNQRFWKRSYILFWLIESCLFVVFLYLTFNANNEPVYMYDFSQIFKTHLFSWRFFLLKIFPIVIFFMLGYFLLIVNKWSSFSKIQIILSIMTLLIVYFTWLEFYQIFHLTQFYGNLSWIYDVDEHLWNLEVEFRRTRITNHYVMICFFAKFFHIIFILIFWMFFVLRAFELKKVTYPLLAANLQNFIFLYIMSWIYMYPWFKFFFRRYLDYSPYWFYLHTHQLGFKLFFNDLKLYYYVVVNDYFSNLLFNLKKFYSFFFYWIENTQMTNSSQFIKHSIRDRILENLF